MERARVAFEAQVQFGQRVIFRTACRHRRPCPESHPFDAGRAHSDGLHFTYEQAAATFDIGERAPDACGQTWYVLGSWEQAEAWLRQGCPIPVR